MKKLTPKESFTNKCAWCDAPLPANSSGFICSAKLQQRPDLRAHEGTFGWIVPRLVFRNIQAFITTKDSPARAHGFDLVMVCCSQKCALELQEGLKEGFDLHDTVKNVVIGSGGPQISEDGKN